VHGAGTYVDLGRAAPDHHHALATVLPLEAPDVLPELLRELPLVRGPLHVGPVQLLHVPCVEGGGHRLDGGEEVLDRLDMLVPVQDPGVHRALVAVVRNRVPCAEHQVAEPREGHEVLDERGATVDALAETDRVHLRETSDRLGQAPPRGLDPRDECGGYGPEAREQDAELALGRSDLGWLLHVGPRSVFGSVPPG